MTSLRARAFVCVCVCVCVGVLFYVRGLAVAYVVGVDVNESEMVVWEWS